MSLHYLRLFKLDKYSSFDFITNSYSSILLTSVPFDSFQGKRLEWCSKGLTKTTGGCSILLKERQYTSLWIAPVLPLPTNMTESSSVQLRATRMMDLKKHLHACVCVQTTKMHIVISLLEHYAL